MAGNRSDRNAAHASANDDPVPNEAISELRVSLRVFRVQSDMLQNRLKDSHQRLIEREAPVLQTTSSAELGALGVQLWELQEAFETLTDKIENVSKRVPPQEPRPPICPICTGPANDAEATPCGHVFCSAHLQQWLVGQNTCPTCRRNVRADDLVPVDDEIMATGDGEEGDVE